jgi:hypothetical protein
MADNPCSHPSQIHEIHRSKKFLGKSRRKLCLLHPMCDVPTMRWGRRRPDELGSSSAIGCRASSSPMLVLRPVPTISEKDRKKLEACFLCNLFIRI